MKRSHEDGLPLSPTWNKKKKRGANTKSGEEEKQPKPFWNSDFSLYGEDDEEDDHELEKALHLSVLSYRNQLAADYKQKGVVRSNPLKPIPKSIFYGRVTEQGESSTAFSTCSVCKDGKPRSGFIADSNDCDHLYCSECIPVYVGKKINDLEDIANVKCPEPRCAIEFYYESFQDFLPNEVMGRWRAAATESSVLYKPLLLRCPFEECAKRFVDDGRGYKIRACPYCGRVFCVSCRFEWHLGKSCEEFWAENKLLRIGQHLRRVQELVGCNVTDFGLLERFNFI